MIQFLCVGQSKTSTKYVYALKNKHRQFSFQKFLSENHLKESERRTGNDSQKWRQYRNVPVISIGFPQVSITEDNYNYKMIAWKYSELLNDENITEYHFSINEYSSKAVLHPHF